MVAVYSGIGLGLYWDVIKKINLVSEKV